METTVDIKVSVIMPSLNVVNYIEECLLSALNQTLDEIEILCIDAKSTDGTWEILNKYAKMSKYKQKIRLIQSDIKSYGYQVNLGIQGAKGKYIAILETDDYIEPNMYQELYVLAEDAEADMAKADYDTFFELPNGKRIYQRVHLWESDSAYYNQVLCPQKIGYLYSHDYSIWKGIYNRDFLLKNQIECNESKGAAFQDIGFMQQVLNCAERVVYMRQSRYRYRIGRELSSINSVKSLMFGYQEFYRLLNETDLRKKILFPEGLYRRMAEVLLTEYTKVLRMTAYDKESKYIKPYYDWFRNMMLHVLEQGVFQVTSMEESVRERLMLLLKKEDDYILKIKESDKVEEDFYRLFFGKNVYIFGAGRVGVRITRELLMRGFIPICICDNNQLLWGTELDTIGIVSPEDGVQIYKKDNESKVFLIANRKFYDEIEKQLILFSIPKNEIIKSI